MHTDSECLHVHPDAQNDLCLQDPGWITFCPRVSNDDRLKKLSPAAEAAILNNVWSARQAGYRHGNRNGCLRGTRTAILDQIELWTRDFNKPPVYWLNGLTWTGQRP